MKTPKMSVSIIIPNWNGKLLLEKHLSEVAKHSGSATLIIVDDCSTDESVSYIQENFPDIRTIRKDRHEGFASPVNVGVREAKTDIVVLLNTDVEPEKGFLEPLISHFSDPTVFAVGCMDKSIEKGKIVLRGRGIGRWEKGFYIHKRGEVDKTDTAWVSGGSSAFRRTIWNELGGMDTIYTPFYWEDIDLSYRAKKKGYRVLFEPKSVVKHFHEDGKIFQRYSRNMIKETAFRNQFFFIWKHASAYQLFLGTIWIPIRLCTSIIRGDAIMVKGFCRALPFFFPIFLKRLKNYC